MLLVRNAEAPSTLIPLRPQTFKFLVFTVISLVEGFEHVLGGFAHLTLGVGTFGLAPLPGSGATP